MVVFQLFFNLFPIILLEEENEKVDNFRRKKALIILLWIIVRWLASPMLSSKVIELIREKTDILGMKFESYWGNELRQKKSHEFIIHLKEELDYGTPYDFTSAPFEAFNKNLKSTMNSADTRSMQSYLLQNLLVRKQWEYDVLQRLKHSSPRLVEACKLFGHNVDKKRVKYKVHPKDDQVSDNSYVIFEDNHRRTFGRIIDINGEEYTVRAYTGTGILEHFALNPYADYEVSSSLYNFIPHGEFGLIITRERKDLLKITYDQIISHCCLLRTEKRSYIMSLEYRGPNK